MNKRAKRLMAGLIVVGLAGAIYGAQSGDTAIAVFGLIVAGIGGLVGKMQREDDAAGH